MPPKEPTKHQLSARLQFQSQTPAFLRAFQNRISGRRDDEDEDAPQIEREYDDSGRGEDDVDESGRSLGLDEFGREVRRDGSAERETRAKREEMKKRGVRGEELEEDGDEKPVVVVLKEGKHLTEFEAENERRKAKGLDPLPSPDAETSTNPTNPSRADQTHSSSKPKSVPVPTPAKSKLAVQIGKAAGSKRKARIVGDDGDDDQEPRKKQKTEQKKKKKAGKNLLSFGDEP